MNFPVCAEPAGLPAQAYYRRANAAELAPWSYEQINEDTYARGLFENLLKKQIEVYPLEDRTQYDLLKKASFKMKGCTLFLFCEILSSAIENFLYIKIRPVSKRTSRRTKTGV